MFGLLIAVIYISFISLGLPDSLLGAAWPTMRTEMNAPISYAGIISMIICFGTIVSSLMSDRITKKIGTGMMTALSVVTTAAALFCFSVSDELWMLFVFAVPYGLGAGGVDAALNNYVALHLKSRHMSWLHCMWGVGAAVSPYIMGHALTVGNGWQQGYLTVAVVQTVLAVCIFISLPLWKKDGKTAIKIGDCGTEQPECVGRPKPLSAKEIVKIPGAVPCFICFLCYCAFEQTTMLWASSYMIHHNGIGTDTAAQFASLFFIGITTGRAVNGFLTFKFSDRTLIRIGQCIILIGTLFIIIPNVNIPTYIGFTVIGLGCAPIYPCIIHSTPDMFGAERAQALIGVQMASAYVGSCFAPMLYGLLADRVSQSLLPYFILVFLALMSLTYCIVIRKTKVVRS